LRRVAITIESSISLFASIAERLIAASAVRRAVVVALSRAFIAVTMSARRVS
jgi:hypothetical protein